MTARIDGVTGLMRIAAILTLTALAGCGEAGPSSDKPKPVPQQTTEDIMRRNYDARGIKYDDKMIRDDARAVDRLNKEFGK